MIIPVWKKIGESSHLLAQKVGREIAHKTKDTSHQKATHTGTLDPMAEGIIVVLTGDDRLRKGEFQSWKKKYTFEMLFGISTDSLDLLGLAENQVKKPLNKIEIERKLQTILPDFLGEQIQVQPAFSAQRVQGKSGFDLAKEGTKFEQNSNTITFFSLRLENTSSVDLSILQKNILQKISLISGNFRQKEITKKWQETFLHLEKNTISQLPLVTITAEVSAKTYVRALVRDLSHTLNIPATTYSIVRTKNGDFTADDII